MAYSDEPDDTFHGLRTAPDTHREMLSARRHPTPLRLCIAVIIVSSLFFVFRAKSGVTAETHGSPALGVQTAEARLFYVAIPASTVQDVDLCKSVLTARILGYPMPNIVRWTVSASEQTSGPQAKIQAILKWFETLLPSSDNSVIALLAGPGSWFQLRPDVLLQRYYNVLSVDPRDGEHVMISASASCSTESEATCARTPRQLPRDAMMLGSVQSVRSLIEQLAEVSKDRPDANVDSLLQKVYDEQNRDAKTSGVRILLDSEHQLSSVALEGSTPEWTATDKLDPLIKDSISPFWTLSGGEQGLPHQAQWTNVKLHTVMSGSGAPTVPVVIHHSQTPASIKPTSQTWWTDLWLQSHARTLFTASSLSPKTAVATVLDERKRRVIFWDGERISDKAGMVERVGMDQNWGLLPWSRFCGSPDQTEELFRDSLGPWQQPDHL